MEQIEKWCGPLLAENVAALLPSNTALHARTRIVPDPHVTRTDVNLALLSEGLRKKAICIECKKPPNNLDGSGVVSEGLWCETRSQLQEYMLNG